MIILAICMGCIIGALIGMNLPMIPYLYSSYVAISIIAALDSVFGGIVSSLKGKFNFKIFFIYLLKVFIIGLHLKIIYIKKSKS